MSEQQPNSAGQTEAQQAGADQKPAQADPAGGTKTGDQPNPDDIWAKARGQFEPKLKAEKEAREAAEAELEKLRNAGKSAEEVKQDYEALQAEKKQWGEQLQQAQSFATQLLESRKSALPDDLKELVELAGDNPEAQLKAIEKAEAIAKSKKPDLQGGVVPQGDHKFNAQEIFEDLQKGKYSKYHAAVKEHGRQAVDKAVNALAGK